MFSFFARVPLSSCVLSCTMTEIRDRPVVCEATLSTVKRTGPRKTRQATECPEFCVCDNVDVHTLAKLNIRRDLQRR